LADPGPAEVASAESSHDADEPADEEELPPDQNPQLIE
jgi:hypothetical protein